MPTATTPGAVAARCPHCNGKLETVVRAGMPTFKRCTSCGVDDRPGSLATTAPAVSRRPCKVEGCPGELDAGGACICCTKRAAYEEAHRVKRECQICGGVITARAKTRYCEACRPVRARVYAAEYSKASAKKVSARG
jgi:hypothetical protein